MAKYEITYSCGHKGTIDVTGSRKYCSDRIEWAETYGVCPDCFRSNLIKKEEGQGLVLCVDRAHSGWGNANGCDFVESHFEGATYTNKETLKAMGYHWTGRKWCANCSIKKFLFVLKQAKEMGWALKAARPETFIASIRKQVLFDCSTGLNTLGYNITKIPECPKGIALDEAYEIVKSSDNECYNVFNEILSIAPELREYADSKYHGVYSKKGAPFKFI